MMNRLRALCAALALAVGLAGLSYAPKAHAQAQVLPPGETCFQATTGVNGMVGVLGNITGGAGGANGIYVAIALTGGSGTQATANITVSGGTVSQIVLLNPGVNYVVGDTLSASSGTIGGVTGFSVPVASISINSSLAGGTVGMYVPSTLTTKQTWANANQTTLNANPVQLDSNGCAIIYGIGAYRQILFDSLGNEVWDQLTTVPLVNPVYAGTVGGTPNAITATDGSFFGGDGQMIAFLATATNTGPTTLAPSGTGTPEPIVKNTPTGPVALTGGEIVSGNMVYVTYSAVNSRFYMGNSPVPSSTTNVVGTFPIQVKDTGAKCDGSTDDTAAIMSGVALGLSTGLGWQFPTNATCKAGQMTWDVSSRWFAGIRIYGGGIRNSILDLSSVTTGTALTIDAASQSSWYSLDWENMQVSGTTTGILAQLGTESFSDALNNLIMSNVFLGNSNPSHTPTAIGLEMNYVVNSNINGVISNVFATGPGGSGIALNCRQCEFDTFQNGSFGNATYGVKFVDGVSFGNTFLSTDVENVSIGWFNGITTAGTTSVIGGQLSNYSTFGVQSTATGGGGAFDFYDVNVTIPATALDPANLAGVRFHDQLPPGTFNAVPTLPATTVSATNTTGKDVLVTVWDGSVSIIDVNGLSISVPSGTFFLPISGTISVTYTGSTKWSWSRVN